MLLRFLLVAGVSTWSVFHSVPVGAAEKSKSHPQRLANRPAGNAGAGTTISSRRSLGGSAAA